MKLTIKRSIACVGLLLLPLAVNAQDQRSDDFVEYRQSAFTAMAWHVKKMGEMIQGRAAYDAAEFKRRAEAVSVLAQLPAEGFNPETKDTTLPNRVKPEVWYLTERFNESMQGLVKATAELAVKAGAEDKNDLRSPYGNVARQCKNCHDRFRETN